MHRRAAICLFAVFAAAGCRRTPSGPDASYQQAKAIYQQLYAAQLDDAYGDPKMDEVVALLKKVDSGSEDADAARAMLGAIQHGREQFARERAEREKRNQAVEGMPPPAPVDIDPSKVLAAGAPDAGPAQDPFGPGSLVSEINAQTGGCLSDNEPFKEEGTGVTGVVYRVAPGPTCAGKLPGYVGQAVLVVNGKVYRRIPDPGPPKPAAPPDAGPPPAPRPAATPAAQADAGPPQPQYYYPGQPQPGATPPAQQQ